jgi:cupin superfamily acireductone dioxygenase involved in methionine salvage
VDLKGFTDKLELLHYAELRVKLHDYTRGTDTEVRYVLPGGLILKFLDSDEGRA